MEFNVPQFIEKEAKIVGPLTFKQFIFVGTASGACILLFFVAPFAIFLIATILLLGGSLALAFVKVEKTSLPVLIKNIFVFAFRPKIYLWRKKPVPIVTVRKQETLKAVETAPDLQMSAGERSRLKTLFNRLETGNK